MTNVHKDALFVLVKSLSKSEKRQFKLYVGRLGVNTDAKFQGLDTSEDFINNTVLKLTKEHQQNNYPKDIRGLFERLGIE